MLNLTREQNLQVSVGDQYENVYGWCSQLCQDLLPLQPKHRRVRATMVNKSTYCIENMNIKRNRPTFLERGPCPGKYLLSLSKIGSMSITTNSTKVFGLQIALNGSRQ